MNIQALVQEFHETFGHPVALTPGLISKERAAFRVSLIEEELQELKDAIEAAGLGVGDGYYTTLVKAKKNDKFLTSGQITACKPFLDREIEAIKPPIIVALGSAAIKHFLPATKGSTAGMIGTSTFNTDLDANIVCGLNPAQIIFNPDKSEDLLKVFQAVAEILS